MKIAFFLLLFALICGTKAEKRESKDEKKRSIDESEETLLQALIHALRDRNNDLETERKQVCAPCPYIYNPVCGSDGRQYDNECFMKLAACEQQTEIAKVSDAYNGCPPEYCQYFITTSYGTSRVQNSHFQYPFPPITFGSFTVTIKGSGDAYISLHPSFDMDWEFGIPKIVIGGWNNQESGFLCNSNDEWQRFPTPNILSPTEAQKFYVHFSNRNDGVNTLKVGLVGEPPFMSLIYGLPDCVLEVKYIGVASGWGNDVEWEYCSFLD